ncbi:MAG: hypothetical protein PHX20_02790 [Candidatus Omnitrophica bacterium]|nr:hypothetical protein [Candidatus Omnitrophota bacterium]MDD5436449.1 hypothetical protein [Candidatus Omnitrophota bacterium]
MSCGKRYFVFAAGIISCCLLFASPAFCADESDLPKLGPDIPSAKGIAITKNGIVKNITPMEEPVLKRIDINKIGVTPYYPTFEGLRLAKYFTIAQRVEIFQEPRPIDSYVLDAKKIRYLHWNQPWNTPGEYRQQIKPIFTRAYGTEVTMSDPRNKDAQWRYTHDYRDIYQNQFPIYRLNPQQLTPTSGFDIPYLINTNYSRESWDQNEILWMYAQRLYRLNWLTTLNFGYRYSTMNAKNDGPMNAYYENRHTYFTYFSLATSDTCEWFGQFEYFKSKRVHSAFIYSPDHYFYAAELRMRSADMKTSVTPRMSYSIDYYYPSRNKFSKYEMQIRAGHEFTPKLNWTNTIKANFAFRDEPDNQAPMYTRWGANPIHDMAGWVGDEIRFQYNFYDKLWFQSGVDLSAGTNVCDFDNGGFLAGLEYYAPGLIRVDVGYRGNYYYNIQDYLTSIYFKCYFFM